MNGADSRWNNRLWACGLTARRIMPGTVRLGVLSGLRNSTRRNSARAIRSGAIQPKTIGLAQFGPKQLARHYSVCAIRSAQFGPAQFSPKQLVWRNSAQNNWSGIIRSAQFDPAQFSPAHYVRVFFLLRFRAASGLCGFCLRAVSSARPSMSKICPANKVGSRSITAAPHTIAAPAAIRSLRRKYRPRT